MPSFLWIFLGAPFIEHLRGRPSLTSALSTVTAAVVGVVLNLAIWFATFALFDTVEEKGRWGATVDVPELSSINWAALAIAVLSGVAIMRFKVPTLRVVLVAAALGIVYQFIFT